MSISRLGAALLLGSMPALADVAGLGWMSGCWSSDGQEIGSGEQWTSPAGGTMPGVSRTVRNGSTVAFEYLRIVTDDDGVIALIASPSGQETARFEMTQMTEDKVVFENGMHDFPQKIIYRLDAGGNLVGRIEGTIDNQNRAVDFPMTRTECGNEE